MLIAAHTVMLLVMFVVLKLLAVVVMLVNDDNISFVPDSSNSRKSLLKILSLVTEDLLATYSKDTKVDFCTVIWSTNL